MRSLPRFEGTWVHAMLRKCRVWQALLLGLSLSSLRRSLYDFLTIGTGPWLRAAPAFLTLAVWVWRTRVMEMLVRHHRRDC